MGKRYDPELRQTEHGSKLYGAWGYMLKRPHCEEWGYFPTFYEWAMQSGYTPGTPLRRIDKNSPYGPENCIWYRPEENNDLQESLDRWNATVNRIREHYGLPPLEVTTYGD